MAERRFKAVVLDLFDTIVKWDPSRLPQVEWRGRRFPSTAPLVMPALREALAAPLDEDLYLDVYHRVVEEIIAERKASAIEITCDERFVRTLRRLAIVPEATVEPLAHKLTRVHMAAVRSVTAAPSSHSAAVRRVADSYRLGLLSNFDDSRTGREILQDTGVSHLFEAVLISADVALRKPNRKIFEMMLEMLKLEPTDLLFVGDTALEDVLGAQGAGIPVAWLSKGKGPYPEELPPADYVLGDLTDLPAVLGV